MDIYDLHIYSKSAYNKDLVKKLVVIKCWNVCEPFTPKLLIEKIQKKKYIWGDLTKLVRLVSETIRHYSYLTKLGNELQRIVLDSRKHELTAEVRKILQGLKN